MLLPASSKHALASAGLRRAKHVHARECLAHRRVGPEFLEIERRRPNRRKSEEKRERRDGVHHLGSQRSERYAPPVPGGRGCSCHGGRMFVARRIPRSGGGCRSRRRDSAGGRVAQYRRDRARVHRKGHSRHLRHDSDLHARRMRHGPIRDGVGAGTRVRMPREQVRPRMETSSRVPPRNRWITSP